MVVLDPKGLRKMELCHNWVRSYERSYEKVVPERCLNLLFDRVYRKFTVEMLHHPHGDGKLVCVSKWKKKTRREPFQSKKCCVWRVWRDSVKKRIVECGQWCVKEASQAQKNKDRTLPLSSSATIVWIPWKGQNKIGGSLNWSWRRNSTVKFVFGKL